MVVEVPFLYEIKTLLSSNLVEANAPEIPVVKLSSSLCVGVRTALEVADPCTVKLYGFSFESSFAMLISAIL